MAGFAIDIAQLLDSLGIGRVDVVGVSAGGPYALGIAHELPGRVRRAAVCSSLSQLCTPAQTPGMRRRIRLALSILARAPGPCAALGDACLPLLRAHPELLMRVIAAHASPAERAQLQLLEARRAASASFLDAAADGVRGMIDDYLACARPCGFQVTDIGAEVDPWHGIDDPLVPIEHALQLAVALPHCRMFLDPGEGHHFFRRRLAEILAMLVGHEEPPSRRSWMRAYAG